MYFIITCDRSHVLEIITSYLMLSYSIHIGILHEIKLLIILYDIDKLMTCVKLSKIILFTCHSYNNTRINAIIIGFVVLSGKLSKIYSNHIISEQTWIY